MSQIKYISFIAVAAFSLQSFAFDTKARQAILMDYTTGQTLYDFHASDKMYPSSMTKMLTVYIAFEQLKKKIFKLDDTFLVTKQAWQMGGSRTFLKLGERVSIEILLNGIIIQSGNDAAVALAEGIAGSQEAFAKKMNETAKKLGLKNSNFTNPDGWPDQQHYSTAEDLAIVARHIIKDYPEYYHYFSKLEYTYNNIKQPNRNLLIARNIGVDGLKTGHTEDGGYGLTASALRNGSRLIAVVNGLGSEAERADEVEKLLDYGFHNFETKTIFKKGQIIEQVEVWNGSQDKVGLTVDKDINMVIPKISESNLKAEISYNSPLPTPIKTGDHIADLKLSIPDYPSKIIPLVAAEDITKLGRVGRAVRKIKLLVWGTK